LEIPGVLGFDLSFDVKIKRVSDSEINIDLSNFNTFFIGASGKVSLVSTNEEGLTIKMNGSAYIPKTAARIFIFGVGGENNFKNLLQDEIDKQIQFSIDRFEQLDTP